VGSLAGAEAAAAAAVGAAAGSVARRTAAGTRAVGHTAEVAAAAGSWHVAWEVHSCAATVVGDARAPARTTAHAGAPRSRYAGTGYP
jgi:hypothetical protein